MSSKSETRGGETKPYTHEDILARLYRIRDAGIDHWVALAESGETRGTATARDNYRDSQQEIDKIEGRLGGTKEPFKVEFEDPPPLTKEWLERQLKALEEPN